MVAGAVSVSATTANDNLCAVLQAEHGVFEFGGQTAPWVIAGKVPTTLRAVSAAALHPMHACALHMQATDCNHKQ
jgi:hypothetical protein